MDLQKLQLEIEELNRSKGWYEGLDDTNPDVHEAKEALIHSELAEALECVRNNDLAMRLEGLKQKPCGLPSELADVAIRILDAMSLKRVETALRIEHVPYEGPALTALQMSAEINRLHIHLANTGASDDLLWLTYCFANGCGIDLDAAIAVKHTFNATRPHRHGGKTL
jgi:NTP pyrophosphatase (non-canonical NTP hydrolase)